MARKLITLLAASLAALVAAPTASAEPRLARLGSAVRAARGAGALRAGRGGGRAPRGARRRRCRVRGVAARPSPPGRDVRRLGRIRGRATGAPARRGLRAAELPLPRARRFRTTPTRPCNGASSPTPGVGVAAAWPRTQGAGQVIAVVDTGVDITHPDLLANLWANPGEVPGNGLDDDGNGMADDVRGRDFVHNDGDPSDHENPRHARGRDRRGRRQQRAGRGRCRPGRPDHGRAGARRRRVRLHLGHRERHHLRGE